MVLLKVLLNTYPRRVDRHDVRSCIDCRSTTLIPWALPFRRFHKSGGLNALCDSLNLKIPEECRERHFTGCVVQGVRCELENVEPRRSPLNGLNGFSACPTGRGSWSLR